MKCFISVFEKYFLSILLLMLVFLMLKFVIIRSVVAEEQQNIYKLTDWKCSSGLSEKKVDNWKSFNSGNECLLNAKSYYIHYKFNLTIVPIFKEKTKNKQVFYSIFFGSIGDADEVYLEGKIIGKTGSFPDKYKNFMHKQRLYPLGYLEDNKTLSIYIKVFTEFPIGRGIKLREIKVGPYSQLSRKLFFERFKRTAGLPLVLVLFCVTSIISWIMWRKNTKDWLHLWAATSSFFMASYTFFLSRFPYEIGWNNNVIYKILVLSGMLLSMSLIFYSASAVKNTNSKRMVFLGLMNILFVLLVLFKTSILEIRIIYIYWFYLFAISSGLIVLHFYIGRGKYFYSKILFFGFLIFFIFAFHDILITLGVIRGINIAHYGLVIFAFLFVVIDIKILHFKIEKNIISKTLILENSEIAHDLQSPLLVIEEGVKDLVKVSSVNKMLILDALDSLKKLMKSLLIQNKAIMINVEGGFEGSKFDILRESNSIYELDTLLEEVIQEKLLQYKFKLGIDLSLIVESKPLRAYIPRIEFKRVISNIINNSYDALISNLGTINVVIRRRNNMISIEILDNGVGISPYNLTQIRKFGFSAEKKDGYGLGLSYAHKVIATWNGNMKINSKLGEYTKVEINIPYFDLSNELDAVLIDDDSLNHLLWQIASKRYSKRVALLFESSEVLISKISKSVPIYIDYNLNGDLNGIEVAKKFHDNGYEKLYITTGYAIENIAKPNFVIKVLGKGFPKELKHK